MSVIDEQIEVEVPVRVAYDQWTQFEDFPRFMEGVEEVRQLDDTHLHWVASIAGVRREWDARITEQLTDEMVAWTSTGGVRNDGLVTFDAMAAHRTSVRLRMDVEPEGAVESVGDALGLVRARARRDLSKFKEFIEGRVMPTGAWRGEVAGGDVTDGRGTNGSGIDHLDRSSAGNDVVVDLGEVPASTGGMVDLDRILGRIPVVLVFTEPLGAPSTDELLAALGQHLADFGRERVQLLAVARVRPDDAMDAVADVSGNVRVLADHDGRLAERFGVRYQVERPVTVLVGADGRHEVTWVDAAGAELAKDLQRRLAALTAR